MKNNLIEESIWYSCWDLPGNLLWSSVEDPILYSIKHTYELLVYDLVRNSVRTSIVNSIYNPTYDSVENSINKLNEN